MEIHPPPHLSQDGGGGSSEQRKCVVHIDEAARDAWLRCMKSAVDEIEADAALKEEMWSYLEGAAQFLVNQPN